jgi:hypothetical protein
VVHELESLRDITSNNIRIGAILLQRNKRSYLYPPTITINFSRFYILFGPLLLEADRMINEFTVYSSKAVTLICQYYKKTVQTETKEQAHHLRNSYCNYKTIEIISLRVKTTEIKNFIFCIFSHYFNALEAQGLMYIIL